MTLSNDLSAPEDRAFSLVVRALKNPSEPASWWIASDAAEEADWKKQAKRLRVVARKSERLSVRISFSKGWLPVESTVLSVQTVQTGGARRELYLVHKLIHDDWLLPGIFPSEPGPRQQERMRQRAHSYYMGNPTVDILPGETVTVRSPPTAVVSRLRRLVLPSNVAHQLLVEDIRVGIDEGMQPSLVMPVPGILFSAEDAGQMGPLSDVMTPGSHVEVILTNTSMSTLSVQSALVLSAFEPL